MRKIIVGEFISLDGVVEAPDTWHFPYVNDEMYAIMWALNERCDTMLLGRTTYLSFAGAFANTPDDDPIGSKMNRPAKVVVSTTLTKLPWRNSTRIAGDVVAEVTTLKEQPGADIVVTGSISLVRTLLRAGLVDELSLFVHPIVVGTGQRLFEESTGPIPFALVDSSRLSTGVMHLVYSLANARG